MFQRIKQLGYFMLFACCLQSCTQIDNYLLGKDNSPEPRALKPIDEKVRLRLVWEVDLDTARQPDVDGKLVPVVQGQTIYVALPNGRVDARDIKNGSLRFSQNLHTRLVSGPAIGEGVLAVGTSASSVVLLNQNTGKVLWEKRLSGQVLSKPVLSQGVVLVKTVDGNLYALSKQNGKRLWKAQHGAPSLILKASSSPLLLRNGLVFVGFSDGKTDVYELRTGQLVGQKGVAYASGASDVERLVDIDADPIAYGNLVLLASYQGEVGALALQSGEFIWHKPASVYKNMVLGAGKLFMIDDQDDVWAIEPMTGQVNWKQEALTARGLTSPVWMHRGLVVVDKLGWLHVLSPKNGALIGRVALPTSVRITPVVSGEQIFVVTQAGRLYCYKVIS